MVTIKKHLLYDILNFSLIRNKLLLLQFNFNNHSLIVLNFKLLSHYATIDNQIGQHKLSDKQKENSRLILISQRHEIQFNAN